MNDQEMDVILRRQENGGLTACSSHGPLTGLCSVLESLRNQTCDMEIHFSYTDLCGHICFCVFTEVNPGLLLHQQLIGHRKDEV